MKTESILSPDRSRSLPPIIPVSEFDRLLTFDAALLENIGGVSTVSAAYVRKCITKRGISIKPWSGGYGSQVNFDAVGKLLTLRGGEFSDQPPMKVIQENRIHGKDWSAIEIYRRLTGTNAYTTAVRHVCDTNLTWLSIVSRALSRGEVLSDNTLDCYAETKNDALRLFHGNELALNTFMNSLDRYGGVQVIYGGPDLLAQFLELNQPYAIKDDYAFGVNADIPQELVMALVPIEPGDEALLANWVHSD